MNHWAQLGLNLLGLTLPTHSEPIATAVNVLVLIVVARLDELLDIFEAEVELLRHEGAAIFIVAGDS